MGNTRDDYKSPIRKDLRWRDWAADEEGMTGDDLLDFVNNSLFPTLKNMKLRNNKDAAKMVRDVFEDSYNYMKSGTLLRQVINKINTDIQLKSKSDRHAFNDIYEQILKDLQSAGNAGEFYTPRPVTQFLVEMIAPKLGETILDPACGTGGFLINAVDFIEKNSKVKTLDERDKLQNGIKGVEKKPLPHMLATTNLILHGIEVPTIDHDNLLNKAWANWTEANRVNVIITNPPFGGMEEDGVENNFPLNVPHQGNRQPVYGADNTFIKRGRPLRIGIARWFFIWRRCGHPYKRKPFGKMQPAYHCTVAQWSVCTLHRY